MDLAARLKELRRQHDETQHDLAAAIGVKPLTISRIERGETAAPDIATLKGIARHYKIELDELLDKGSASAPAPYLEAGASEPAMLMARDGGAADAPKRELNRDQMRAVLAVAKERNIPGDQIEALEDIARPLASLDGYESLKELLDLLYDGYLNKMRGRLPSAPERAAAEIEEAARKQLVKDQDALTERGIVVQRPKKGR